MPTTEKIKAIMYDFHGSQQEEGIKILELDIDKDKSEDEILIDIRQRVLISMGKYLK